jgi:hypothetical protein
LLRLVCFIYFFSFFLMLLGLPAARRVLVVLFFIALQRLCARALHMSVCTGFRPVVERLQMCRSSECVAQAKSPFGLLRLLDICLGLLTVQQALHHQIHCF